MLMLLRELLPAIELKVSRRARCIGRIVEAVMDRSPAEFGVCLALAGGFLFGRDGDGDVLSVKAPFV